MNKEVTKIDDDFNLGLTKEEVEAGRGIEMKDNVVNGKPMKDQTSRKREDGAMIHRVSEGESFKATNVKACYDKLQRMKEKSNYKELLFCHYHFSDREIEFTEREIDRIKEELTKKPSEEITSVLLDVDRVRVDYSIDEFKV